MIEYWSCPDCGKDFSDVDCKTVATDLTIAIDPAKHKETKVTYANDGDTHSATYDCCGATYVTDEEHTYDQDGDKCICGAGMPWTIETKGTMSYKAAGNVVTVTHTQACKVGYWDATAGKYIAIAAVANDDGSYSFTIPETAGKLLIVVKGDVTGDGKLNAADTGKLNSYVLKRGTLTAEAMFAGEVTGDGKYNAGDTGKMNAAILGRAALTWN